MVVYLLDIVLLEQLVVQNLRSFGKLGDIIDLCFFRFMYKTLCYYKFSFLYDIYTVGWITLSKNYMAFAALWRVEKWNKFVGQVMQGKRLKNWNSSHEIYTFFSFTLLYFFLGLLPVILGQNEQVTPCKALGCRSSLKSINQGKSSKWATGFDSCDINESCVSKTKWISCFTLRIDIWLACIQFIFLVVYDKLAININWCFIHSFVRYSFTALCFR